jgi:hypothetical protein
VGNNRIAGYYQPEPMVAREHVSRDCKCQLCGDDYGISPFRYYDGRRLLKLCRYCQLDLLRDDHNSLRRDNYTDYHQDDGRGVLAFIGVAGVVFVFVIVFLIVK